VPFALIGLLFFLSNVAGFIPAVLMSRLLSYMTEDAPELMVGLLNVLGLIAAGMIQVTAWNTYFFRALFVAGRGLFFASYKAPQTAH
jgi:hypothetical protein